MSSEKIFLREVKRCYKLYQIKNKAIREAYSFLSWLTLNDSINNDGEGMLNPRLDRQVWKYKYIRHRSVGRDGWSTFKSGRGSSLPDLWWW